MPESTSRSTKHPSALSLTVHYILTNTYREDIDLFIDGESIFSQEGTTQGDPLAMAMYATAITPLINRLETELVKQTSYADDAAVGGKLVDLKAWWDRLTDFGPDYGYFPNAKKKLANCERKQTIRSNSDIQ